jgi:hypothetical protein
VNVPSFLLPLGEVADVFLALLEPPSRGQRQARMLPRQHPLMLDMRVIFADMSVGLQGLSSVKTEGSAWLIPICV